jgi:AcrR family transcriptional regulator
MSAKPSSLRDAHRKRTSRALRQAALELFASQGYDTTKTEEVAEKAGVSARTFFRYFPTKESVLDSGQIAFIQSFVALYLNVPRTVGDLEAMHIALRDLSVKFSRGRNSLRLYEKIVASSLALRGRKVDHQEQHIRTIAEAIAKRNGFEQVDDYCTLVATIGMLPYRRALDAWVNSPEGTLLGDLITKEFELLVRTLDKSPARGVAGPRAALATTARRARAG